jgi:transposase
MKKLHCLTREVLYQLCCEQDMNLDQIAKHLNVGASSVCRALKQFGLQRSYRHKDKSGYILCKVPDHPHADYRGWVREHRLVMEQSIGRYLLPTEQVHHRNEVVDDNRIENLELFASNADHRSLRHFGPKSLVGIPSEVLPPLPTPEELVELYKTHSGQQIAKMYSRSNGNIYNLLKSCGIETVSKRTRSLENWPEPHEVSEMIKQSDVPSVARQLGKSEGGMYRWMRKHGVAPPMKLNPPVVHKPLGRTPMLRLHQEPDAQAS